MSSRANRRSPRPVPAWLAAFVAPTLWADAGRVGPWGFIWRSSVWCLLLEAVVHLGRVAVRSRDRPWREIWLAAEILQTTAASTVPVVVLSSILWFILRETPSPE